ncbi:MAG: hypothetical protein EXR86_09310 [Gammaproteobacteria bacterium]|nr:hypothetical protein [Gammaproteobacteria bacterium]
MNTTQDLPAAPRRVLWPVLACVIAIPLIMHWLRPPHAEPVYCDEQVPPGDDTVIMLSASWCGYCARARNFFVNEKIAYCEYDIEKSTLGAARHRESGAQGVPVIVIDGIAQFGFSLDAIKQALAARSDLSSYQH